MIGEARRAFETDYELFRDGCSRQWCKSGLCLTRYHSYTTSARLKTASSTAPSTFRRQPESKSFNFIDRACFKQYIYPFFFRILIIIKKKRYERWAVWKSVYFLIEIARLLVSLFLWSNERIIPASSDIDSMISVTRRYLRYLPVFLLLFSLFFLDKGSSLPPSSSRGILNNERSLYWSQFTQLLPIKVNRDCYLLNNPVSGSKCNANIRRIPAAIIGDRFRNNRSFRINFRPDIALIRSNTFPGSNIREGKSLRLLLFTFDEF